MCLTSSMGKKMSYLLSQWKIVSKVEVFLTFWDHHNHICVSSLEPWNSQRSCGCRETFHSVAALGSVTLHFWQGSTLSVVCCHCCVLNGSDWSLLRGRIKWSHIFVSVAPWRTALFNLLLLDKYIYSSKRFYFFFQVRIYFLLRYKQNQEGMWQINIY